MIISKLFQYYVRLIFLHDFQLIIVFHCCYNKISNMKWRRQQKGISYSSRCQKSGMALPGLMWRCQQDCAYRGSRAETISCMFQLPECPGSARKCPGSTQLSTFPLACTSFGIWLFLENQKWLFKPFSSIISLTLTLLHPSLIFKNPND